MNKFAAYQTNKRKWDDRGHGSGGFRGGRGGGGDHGAAWEHPEKRARREEKFSGREGREKPLDIFIDTKFNYWNLPVKARVLLISNLPQALQHTDLLYNLFSFYGDVERVKMMTRRSVCALVEFSTATFACIARDYLDQIAVKGETLCITFSKYEKVRMPEEFGQPPDSNTKDFSGEEFQKFKRYWSEDLKKNNMRKITKPTATVHISGIQAGKSPNDVKTLFETYGLKVVECVGVAVKAKGAKDREGTATGLPRMFCYVQFESADDGIIGLAQFGNKVGMRISFAKDSLAILKGNCIEKNLPLIQGDEKAV